MKFIARLSEPAPKIYEQFGIVGRFVYQYGTNVAGLLYLLGNLSFGVDGLWTNDPYKIATAVATIGASSITAAWGRYDNAFVMANILGLVGATAINIPGMNAGYVTSYFSMLLYGAVAYLGINSKGLEKKYSDSPSSVVRAVFGHPRESWGWLAMIAKAPLLYYALSTQDYGMMLSVAVLYLGNIMTMIAPSERTRNIFSSDHKLG